MKQKAITLILTLIAILAPLLIIPSHDDAIYNIPKLIVMLTAGLVLLILMLASYKNLSLDKKDVILLIFMGLVFISTFLSININKAIFGEKNRYEGLLMFATYICIYFCSKKYFKYEKLSKIFNIMYYVSMCIGILGIMQKYISYKPLYPLFNKGMAGTFGNSNFFGSFISIILPISAVIFILKGNKKSFVLCLVMFFNMIASGTRSAWVAFAVVGLIGLIYLIKQKNKKYYKRTLPLFVCYITISIYLFGGFGFMPKTVVNSSINSTNDPAKKVQQTQKDFNEMKDTGISRKMGSNRIAIWNMSLNLMIKNPIFGCGPDNLSDGLIRDCLVELSEYANRMKKLVDKAHNEYLHIGATLGIPALVCYLVFLSLIIFPKMKLMLNNPVYFTICLAIISYLAQAFFNISTIGVAPLFWMILGLIDNKEFIKQLEKNSKLEYKTIKN